MRELLSTAANKDIDTVTTIFRDAVGDVLLRHKDDPTVTLEKMAGETNQSVL